LQVLSSGYVIRTCLQLKKLDVHPT
jgi:hypothetical protein